MHLFELNIKSSLFVGFAVAPVGLLVVLMEAEVGTTKASDIELVCITRGRP